MNITKEKLAELQEKADRWDKVEVGVEALGKEVRDLRILVAGLEAFHKTVWQETMKAPPSAQRTG